MRRLFTKAWPYLTALVAGTILWFIGIFIGGRAQDLMINIAAAFYAIPVLFLVYQQVKKISESRLNKEINDYIKMITDKEILSILNHLIKRVVSYGEVKFSPEDINRFLNQKVESIEASIKSSEFIGFQLLKSWDETEKNLSELLTKNHMVTRLKNDAVIALICTYKAIQSLHLLQKRNDLFNKSDKVSDKYRLVIPPDNPEQARCLLLHKLDDNKGVVTDFGDFNRSVYEDLLRVYFVKEEWVSEYANSIYDVLLSINSWLSNTGYEFVVDPQEFRIAISSGD